MHNCARQHAELRWPACRTVPAGCRPACGTALASCRPAAGRVARLKDDRQAARPPNLRDRAPCWPACPAICAQAPRHRLPAWRGHTCPAVRVRPSRNCSASFATWWHGTVVPLQSMQGFTCKMSAWRSVEPIPATLLTPRCYLPRTRHAHGYMRHPAHAAVGLFAGIGFGGGARRPHILGQRLHNCGRGGWIRSTIGKRHGGTASQGLRG